MIHSLLQRLENVKMEESAKMKNLFEQMKPGEHLRITLQSPGNKGKKQTLQGICIAIRHRGISSSFTVRNYLSGEGLEYTFYPYSGNISDIQRVEENKPKIQFRRAKLYYLRHRTPKESTV